MSQEPRPSGAVCRNEIVASGLNAGLQQRGIEVGKDFSIIGHENIEETGLSGPPMTVTSFAFKKMGRQVSKLLIQRVAEPDHRLLRQLDSISMMERKNSVWILRSATLAQFHEASVFRSRAKIATGI